ncbi:MAG: hypothetical protein L7T84_11260 [Akkermansiaceae bacterium]|nr:hypothetical protein [Akkermansiaceae bacterium]
MIQIIYRIILLWAVGGPLMAIYLMINHRENLAHNAVTMPEWVPFWPLLAIPYLGMLVLPACLSLFIKEQRDFYQYLVSITIAFLVVGSIWYFYPTEMVRPPIPGDWQSHVYREMVSIDKSGLHRPLRPRHHPDRRVLHSRPTKLPVVLLAPSLIYLGNHFYRCHLATSAHRCHLRHSYFPLRGSPYAKTLRKSYARITLQST